MMNSTDLSLIKQIPILEIADRIHIKVRNKKALCFGGHDKRTPSLSFLLSKNTWKCFGCEKKGDGISLVMEVLGYDFKTTLDWFDHEFYVDVRRATNQYFSNIKRYNSNNVKFPQKHVTHKEEPPEFKVDSEIYAWLMNKCGDVSESTGVNYLNNHGISREVAKHFGVRELCNPDRAFCKTIERWGSTRVFNSGLAWGKQGVPECLIWTSYAILFPFHIKNKIEYIQGRTFKKDPKYLNPRGIAKPLFNIDCLASLTPGAVIHLCEGVPDTLALEGQGLAAIGVLGASSFREEWVDLFMKFDVVLMPDGDHGGEIFFRTISELFAARGKPVSKVRIPDGRDVADVIADMKGNA